MCGFFLHWCALQEYGDVQKAQVLEQVQAWLQSDEPADSIVPLQLLSLRHIKEVLFATKVGVTCVSAHSR